MHICVAELSGFSTADVTRDLIDDTLQFRHNGSPRAVSLNAGLTA